MSNKYYIYCSNNQAYHAFINNSIVAKSVMKEDFRSDTLSYLSADYLFVTKEKLSKELRNVGVSEFYYGVAFEIEDIENSIMAVLVIKEENGEVRLTDKCKLNDYDSVENCIGAFICGEIPISYLSGIIFDNEEQKKSFSKSSLDLWFPKEMYKVFENDVISYENSIDIFRNAAEIVNELVAKENIETVRNIILYRNRMKAALYYALEATKDWNIGAICGNIDSTMMKILDKNKCLEKLINEYFQTLEGMKEAAYKNFMIDADVVLEKNNKDINSTFFKIIIDALLKDTSVRSKLTGAILNDIGQKCIDCSGSERENVVSSMNIIIRYLTSNMDPDEAMSMLGKYNVLRAFMVFMDQPENADFLKRASSKLSQKERRYAYIMYGILNGMSEVERNQKSNRKLEVRLEEKVMEMFPSEYLINNPLKNGAFIREIDKSENGVFGIVPSFKLWYDCKTSQEIFLKSEDEMILEKIYLAMKKICKEDPIPEQDIYTLEKPAVIKLQIGEDVIETFQILRKKDAKIFGKKIEKAFKTQKEVFNVKGFKIYLAEEKRYQKFYKKNIDIVQELCGKVKNE